MAEAKKITLRTTLWHKQKQISSRKKTNFFERQQGD
jgi:hypothetical protein